MGKRKTSGCRANTRDSAQLYACNLPPHLIPAASIQRRQQTCLRLELDNECRGSAESNTGHDRSPLRISPLDRGRNGAGVWYPSNTNNLLWQTVLSSPIDNKRLSSALANRFAGSVLP
jgi:hypothetical protein